MPTREEVRLTSAVSSAVKPVKLLCGRFSDDGMLIFNIT